MPEIVQLSDEAIAVLEAAADGSRRRGRATLLAARLQMLAEGELVSYEELGQILGLDHLDSEHKKIISAAAKTAADRLLDSDHVVYRAVRGHGYERAAPEAVVQVVRQHQGTVEKHVNAALVKARTINVSTVDGGTAAVVRAMVTSLARQDAIVRTMDVRQRNLEDIVAAVGQGLAHTAQRVEAHDKALDEIQRDLRQLRGGANVPPAQNEISSI